MKDKKVLIVVGNLRENNGVANCMMNYYSKIISENYKVDFLCLTDVESCFKEIILKSNSNCYVLPEQNLKLTETNKNYIKDILKNNTYDVIHVNIIGKIACNILKEAKENNINVRILHSHNPRELNSMKNLARTLMYTNKTNKYANVYLACTEKAGKSIFRFKKFEILNNAIALDKYKYNSKFRNEFREQYNINDKFVIGTSCRHAKQKNPFFIIDVFYEYYKMNQNAVLLWAGTGPLTIKLKEYVIKKNLEKNVIFLGNRKDMNNIYSAMDVFILPSIFEGLGMVFIEAQCNGLFCFASKNVYKDTAVTNNIEYISLKKTPKYWANKIYNLKLPDREKNYDEVIGKSGYDIKKEEKKLYELYERHINSNKGR